MLMTDDLIAPHPGGATLPSHTRYDRVAGSHSQNRPRYPDALIAHLADRIGTANTAAFALDIGSGTGAFTRRLRPALPSFMRLIGIEPGRGMLAQALAETGAETGADAGIAFVAGTAEATPIRDGGALVRPAVLLSRSPPRRRSGRRARDRRICPRRGGPAGRRAD